MVALYRAGRQAEALRAYQDLRTILGEELGLEPSSTLQRLEGAILRHEPELDWPPAGDAEPSQRRAGAVVPGGVMTFLFTDLVGSTELLDRLGEDSAEDLRRTHFTCCAMRWPKPVASEVKSLGDGLMVAFASPLAALRCSVAIQQAIAEHNRSTPSTAPTSSGSGCMPANRFGPRRTSSAPPWSWPDGSATTPKAVRSWPAASSPTWSGPGAASVRPARAPRR